jgi:outer membrane protein assembly factor BamA
MSVAGILLLLGVARAQAPDESIPDAEVVEGPVAPAEVPWWVGLPVAYVRLQAVDEGSLPEENFEPLLHVEPGAPLRPRDIATDIETLFQVGEFSAVEADAQPWVTTDDRGEPVAGVLLTYRLAPAPKVARIRVQGNRRFRDREILDASGVADGQVFYPKLDGAFLAASIERWLERQGQDDPSVQVRTTEPEAGQLYVLIEVDEGRPNTLERLTFAGDLGGVATDAQLRRWMRKAGVKLGRPLAQEAVLEGQEEIRRQLGSVQRGPLRRQRGYISARVQPLLLTTETGARLTYTIEPGPALELVVRGLGYGGERLVQDALGIDHRLRVTRGFLDQAPDKLVTSLQERGWLAAEATVTREQPSPEVDRLIVDVDLGPKHVIGDIPDVGFVDFGFGFEDPPSGAAAQSREASELQAVFDQASPDVLRRDFYTDAAMAAGAEAARLYYVDRGFLDAALEVREPEIRARRSPANLWRLIVGTDRHMRVTPEVYVTRGQVTTLASLELQGPAEGVDLGFFEAAVAERVGAPYSPQKLDSLARRVVEVHRAAGYLGADARVQQSALVGGDHRRAAAIVVEPGDLIVLRSVVTRGTRNTRPSFVQNVVDLHPGSPITSEDLEQVRSRLYQLGVFQSLDLRLLGDGQARDLLVTLAERKRWSLELAPGVSTDQGLRAWGRVVRRNLFGRAQQIELLGQVGWEFRSDDVRDWLLDFERPEWRAALQYSAPRFPGRRDELILDLVLRERRQERTWQMDRSGAGMAIEHRFRGASADVSDDLRLRLGARVEGRQLIEVDGGALLPGEPWQQMLRENDRALPTPWRPQESLNVLGIYDLRDDPVQPHRGALLSANFEYAPGIPWGGLQDASRAAFVKNETRISGYVPLGGLTLHMAAGAGYIVPIFGVPPLEDRFRLGGTGSLRGFVRDTVGPQRPTPPLGVDWPGGIGPAIDHLLRDDPQRWTPTGGDTSASVITELLMPLPALGLTGWDGYAAELFVDAGNVWLLNPELEDLQDDRALLSAAPFFRIGVGAGMRVETPVGPLQLDLALNPQAAFATGDRRELLVNEWREPSVRAHLTLGALW